MIKYIQKCRGCDHKDLIGVINLGRQSIQGSFIYPEKILPPQRSLDSNILFCNPRTGGCGLIQNEISISPEILYSNYGYRSSVSSTMKNHLEDIVKNIISMINIENPEVLDIGMNDGYMLKQYPDNYKKYGVDPSDIANEVNREDITVINKCFPCLELENFKFDVITSIACFYDIERPLEFCEEIYKKLNDNGIWVVEFAYLPMVLDNLAYDGMVHEHLCLYSLDTFEKIIQKCKLKIIKAKENDTNGGSLQVWLTKSDNVTYENQEFKNNILKLKIKEFDKELDNIEIYNKFSDRIKQHKKDLLNQLNQLKLAGKNIHIYGMSTKLNTILNYCDINTNLIEFAAERSLEKHGAKTISGIKMISEEESRKTVDLYLVGPYHFKNEILNREQEMIKKGVQFLFPLPNIHLI